MTTAPIPINEARERLGLLPLVDCPDEKNHVWERLKDGSAYCVWCEAKVRRVGRE